MKQNKSVLLISGQLVPGIDRKKIMYVNFLKRYAIMPMIEVEFAMIVAPLVAIGYDSSTRSAVRLQPVQGLIQVKRHDSIEYM